MRFNGVTRLAAAATLLLAAMSCNQVEVSSVENEQPAAPEPTSEAAGDQLILQIGLGYDSDDDPDPQETGRVVIQLLPDVAPMHVERMTSLAAQGFYDGVVFHRVIDGFMAQTGDPTGTGSGGSENPDLRQEFSNVPFERGVVGMARSNHVDSANSQFFVMFARTPSLDRSYTVVGRVTEGMDVIDRIKRGPSSANGVVRGGRDRIVSAEVGASQ